jgi:hypothetical protein
VLRLRGDEAPSPLRTPCPRRCITSRTSCLSAGVSYRSSASPPSRQGSKPRVDRHPLARVPAPPSAQGRRIALVAQSTPSTDAAPAPRPAIGAG